MAKHNLKTQTGTFASLKIMNTKATPLIHFTLLTSMFLASRTCVHGGSFSSDFNSGLPAGSATYGNAAVSGSGGFTNSGCAQLTPDVGSQHGTFIITNDLDAGTAVVSFTASFKVLIGGNQRWNYADGMSFNFAPDITLGTWGLEDEGSGTGLTIDLDTFGGAIDPWPAARVTVAHFQVGAAETYMDHLRAGQFVDAVVQLNPNQTLNFIYDGVYVCSNLDLSPLLYTPMPGSIFGLGARTGGNWETHFVDDLNIVTCTNPAPFVNSFAPRGRQAAANSSIDVVLADFSTQANTNSIVLTLDGATVSPTITQDGAGNTSIHFAPGVLSASSQHSVSVSFADNAGPPQTQSFSWQFTVTEAAPATFVTVFSDDLESYAVGALDKNAGGGPNAAPNGSGNPWFGPYPDNFSIVTSGSLVVDGTNLTIMPHSGTKMMTRSYYQYLCTEWLNLAYRCHGGQPIKGNCMLEWWYFDPTDQASAFEDYLSLYYYNVVPSPATADWPGAYDSSLGLYWDVINWSDANAFLSVSLGGSRYNPAGGNYDATKYQIRLEEFPGHGTYGIDGWVNTITRTQGWHQKRIVLGSPQPDGTVMVWFYVDDMVNSIYSGTCTLGATGFSLIEIDSGLNTTPAYYDDFKFALAQPPNLAASRSGNNMVLTWPGGGFTLQKSDSVTGGWTNVAGAVSGYTYDATSGPKQFFRLKN